MQAVVLALAAIFIVFVLPPLYERLREPDCLWCEEKRKKK